MEGIIPLVLGLLVVIIVLPFVALVKASSLGGRIAQLESEIAELRRAVSGARFEAARPRPEPQRAPETLIEPPRPSATAPAEAPRPVEIPVQAEEPIEPEIPAYELEEEEEIEAPVPTSSRTGEWASVNYAQAARPSAPTAPSAPARPSRTNQEWEMLIGGNIFNRIGAIALLIGVAYLLKYSFEHNWITPWMRVTMGFGTGAVLLFLGSRFCKKEIPVFAQGLIGAGIAVLYLTAYASFNLYHLVSQPVAMALMAATTAIAVMQALKYDALAVSLIGLLGGFLTPLILSTDNAGGSSDAVGLFIYLALLDAGLLAVTLKKEDWAVMEVLTLAGTYLTYFIWHGKYYTPEQISATVPFLIVAWALFYALDLYRVTRQTNSHPDVRILVPIINSAAFYAGMYLDINSQHHNWMGLATFLIALTYFVTMLILIRKHASSLVSIQRYAVTAIALLAIGTGIQFTGFPRVALWAMEALGLTWCGVHWRSRYVWIPALGLFITALFGMLLAHHAFGYEPDAKFMVIWNERFMAYTVLAASMAIAAALLRKLEDELATPVAGMLNFVWCTVFAGCLTVETTDHFRKLIEMSVWHGDNDLPGLYRSMALAMVWTAFSLPLILAGLRKRVSEIVFAGTLLTMLAVGFVAVSSLYSTPNPALGALVNYRMMTFLTVIGALFVQQCWFRRWREGIAWAALPLGAFDFVISALGFEALTIEILAYFHRPNLHYTWGYGISTDLAQYLTLAIVWAIYSLPLVWHGLRRGYKVYTCMGAITLIAAVLFSMFPGIGSLDKEPLVPLVNYRLAAFLMVLAAMLIEKRLFQRRNEEYKWVEGTIGVFDLVIALYTFGVLTVEILAYYRRFELHMVPWESGIERELAQTLALASAWIAYSLPMVWQGLRRNSIIYQIIGLGALAAAIVNLAADAYSFQPAQSFAVLWNPRAAAYVLGVAGMLTAYRMLMRHADEHTWVTGARTVFRVVISLFIFELITVEIWDYFRHAMETSQFAQLQHFRGFRQAALSVAWVSYSIVLMSYGIWRRVPLIRMVALALFYLTIAKVFFFDLSHLETLYRIFSFIGLGLILLATSYLYQRFKSMIVDVPTTAEEGSV